jgi:hypothetical protein
MAPSLTWSVDAILGEGGDAVESGSIDPAQGGQRRNASLVRQGRRRRAFAYRKIARRWAKSRSAKLMRRRFGRRFCPPYT